MLVISVRHASCANGSNPKKWQGLDVTLAMARKLLIFDVADSLDMAWSGVYLFGWAVLVIGVILMIVGTQLPLVACTPAPFAGCIAGPNVPFELVAAAIAAMGLLLISVARHKKGVTPLETTPLG